MAQLAGMERILSDKMNYLSDKLNYDIWLVTYEQGGHPYAFSLSEKIHHTDIDVLFYKKHGLNFIQKTCLYLQMRKTFKKRLYEIITKVNPDIIICTTYSYPLLDIIINSPGKGKYVLETHIAKNFFKKTSEVNEHSFLFRVAKLYDAYFFHYIKKFDYLVTLTQKDADDWKKTIPNSIVIPNCLTHYPEKPAKLENKTIISTGRLHEQKGYDLLIKAWEIVHGKHQDWTLNIYGSGDDKEKLINEVNQRKLADCLRIYPSTPYIYTQYDESSFLVMSSRYEGFGLVLIEAMACGLPCIAFDCPHGPSDIIVHNQTGLLVENGNIDKLSDAICMLIENQKNRQEMGKAARGEVTRYLPNVIMEQWDNLFKSLNQQ